MEELTQEVLLATAPAPIDKLATALAKAQGEFPAIPKTGKNPHLKNEYSTLDDIIGGIRAPLAKHGLAFVQLLDSNSVGVIMLRTILLHESGQQLESSVVVEAGSEHRGINALQALGSSITYMKRYSLSAMLGIATDTDSDGNGATAQPRKPKAQAQPQPAPPQEGRPLNPPTLRLVMRKKAGWHGDQRTTDGEPITEKQVPYTATLMGELFPNLGADLKQKARYDVLNYLIGVTSTKDLFKAEASALIDWMTKDKEMAMQEAAKVLEAIAIEQGQQELPL